MNRLVINKYSSYKGHRFRDSIALSQKAMKSWVDLPVELQRKVFSFLKYPDIQKKRGVNRWWCIVANSLDIESKDAESQNVSKHQHDVVVKVRRHRYKIFIAQWTNHSGIELSVFLNEDLKRNSLFEFSERNNLFEFSEDLFFIFSHSEIKTYVDFLKWNKLLVECPKLWNPKQWNLSYKEMFSFTETQLKHGVGCRCCMDFDCNNISSLKCISGRCKACCKSHPHPHRCDAHRYGKSRR